MRLRLDSADSFFTSSLTRCALSSPINPILIGMEFLGAHTVRDNQCCDGASQ